MNIYNYMSTYIIVYLQLYEYFLHTYKYIQVHTIIFVFIQLYEYLHNLFNLFILWYTYNYMRIYECLYLGYT